MDKEKKEDEEDIFTQTEIIIKKIQEQMRLTEEALNLGKPRLGEVKISDNSKSMMIPQKKNIPQNTFKIRESVQEYLNINLEQNFTEKPEKAPFDDSCSICKSKIYFNKYICVVCNDFILCPKCEIEHEHPVLKCKFNQLSSLESLYIYINTKNQEIKNNRNNSGFLSNIFSNKYELKLECDTNELTMRPNTKKNIPLTIYNLSNTEFDCDKNKVVIYGRNSKDLKVYSTILKDKINKSEKIEALITLEAKDKKEDKDYIFHLELYSLLSSRLKSNMLIFKVKVNEDQEDEELDEYFKDYPKIAIQSKSIKNGVKKLMQDTKKKYDPITLLIYLIKNKGNVDDAYYQLNFSSSNKSRTIN